MKSFAHAAFKKMPGKPLILVVLILLLFSACDPEKVEDFKRNDALSDESCVEYRIQSEVGFQYLQAQGPNIMELVKIAPLEAAPASSQKWFLTPVGDGYYMIKSELGKYLDVAGANDAPGTPVHMWKFNAGKAQRWKFIASGDSYFIQSELGTYLEVKDDAPRGFVRMNSARSANGQQWKLQLVEATKRLTSFKPPVHGFKFTNDFKVSFPILELNAEFGGQCGGMVYSALDYYYAGRPIPTQDFRPAARTILANYIFERQSTSTINNIDKWGELVGNPFGWRTDQYFRWGLEGINPGDRISELKSFIDAGKPVPLGLFKAGNGGFGPHHQVLAIGYDMRRYKGDFGDFKEDFRIFIYDPNHPLEKVTLVANPAANSYYYTEYPDEAWMTYFVDKKYAPRTAPEIAHTVLPNDGLVRKLLLEIRTGGDDLRGGNDNVHAIINLTNGTDQSYLNINNLARWPNNYTETVEITLTTPVPLNTIRSVTLKTTLGGDNWNVDSFRIIAYEGTNFTRQVYFAAGTPLVRFTSNNSPFVAVLSY